MQVIGKKSERVVRELCAVINSENLTNKEILEILSTLLYSTGVWLEGTNPPNSEEILMRYSQQPTLGNALMAQAKFMLEAWKTMEEENAKPIQSKKEE